MIGGPLGLEIRHPLCCSAHGPLHGHPFASPFASLQATPCGVTISALRASSNHSFVIAACTMLLLLIRQQPFRLRLARGKTTRSWSTPPPSSPCSASSCTPPAGSSGPTQPKPPNHQRPSPTCNVIRYKLGRLSHELPPIFVADTFGERRATVSDRRRLRRWRGQTRSSASARLRVVRRS